MKTEEECPGELHCTTEPDGKCVVYKTTLEHYCRRDQCPLYFTKRSSVPVTYEALLEAAVRIKERQLNGQSVSDKKLLLYEMTAYSVFQRAERIVDNKRSQKSETNDPTQRGMPGRGFTPGNSSAFQFTDEQLRQMYEDRKNAQAKRSRKPRTLE